MGFTMVEVLTACVVITVMLSVAVMSPKGVRQTAKREAEKLQAHIYRTMQKADRIHKNFYLEYYTTFVRVNWHDIHMTDDSYKVSDGCRYDFPDDDGTNYNASKRRFTKGGTITVYGADGETWYVIMAGINEGRVRISDVP